MEYGWMDGWMDMIVTGKKGDGSISKKKIQKKIMIGRIFIYYCEKIAKEKKGCMQSVSVWVVFFFVFVCCLVLRRWWLGFFFNGRLTGPRGGAFVRAE